MRRRVRTLLGAAALAAAALCILGAGPAGAATVLESSEYPATLSGEQTETVTFGFGGPTASCESATVEGTLLEASAKVAVAPSFAGCKAFGFLEATVVNNGCSFQFEVGPNTLGVECEEEATIVITAATCQVEIGAQAGSESVKFIDLGTGTVSFALEVAGFGYTVSKDGFLCPLSGTGEFENGTVEGAYVIGELSLGGASQLNSTVYPDTVSGEQTETVTFGFGGQTASCESATVEGTLSEASATVAVAPSFAGCKAFGFLEATINTNGCSFHFEVSAYTFAVECEEKAAIVISAGTCELEIGPQAGVASLNVLDTWEGTVRFVLEVTGLKYTVTEDGFLCPLSGTGEFKNGTLGGAYELSGAEGSLFVS